jgi:hypothetical protein
MSKPKVMIGEHDRYASVVVAPFCFRMRGRGGESVEILRWNCGAYDDLGVGLLSLNDGTLTTEADLPAGHSAVMQEAFLMATKAPRCPYCAAPGPHCVAFGSSCDAHVGGKRVPVCRVCAHMFPLKVPAPHPVLVEVYTVVTALLERYGEHEGLRRYLGCATDMCHKKLLDAADNCAREVVKDQHRKHGLLAAAWAMAARYTDVDCERAASLATAHQHAARAIEALGITI